MADNEQHASGAIPRMFEEFVSQLRAGTERLEAFARSGGRLPPGPDVVALPGAISAAQVTSIADSIARAAAQHRGAEGPAVLVRRAARRAGGDARPARGVEQGMG